MIQRSVFLIIMFMSNQAVTDPIGTIIDPKHELLAEVVGRYFERTHEQEVEYQSQKGLENVIVRIMERTS